MLTRDQYVALLEKRASEHLDPLHESIAPNDSAELMTQQQNQVHADDRDYLHSVFAHAAAVQNNQSSELKKLFPGMHASSHPDSHKRDVVTSSPLIKVARDTFFAAIEETNFLKTASPFHLELAYRSFVEELEKIAAAAQTPPKKPLNYGRPTKVWDLSAQAGHVAPAAAVGTGTTLNKGGLLSRLLNR